MYCPRKATIVVLALFVAFIIYVLLFQFEWKTFNFEAFSFEATATVETTTTTETSTSTIYDRENTSVTVMPTQGHDGTYSPSLTPSRRPQHILPPQLDCGLPFVLRDDSTLNIPPPEQDLSRGIFLINGEQYGRTCNQYQSVMCGVWKVMKERNVAQRTVGIANAAVSAAIRELDMIFLQRYATVLLDCNSRGSSTTVTCLHHSRGPDGTRMWNEVTVTPYEIATFEQTFYYSLENLVWKMESPDMKLPHIILPSYETRVAVDREFDLLTKRQGEVLTIAIHRRWFEGACHDFVRAGMFFCFNVTKDYIKSHMDEFMANFSCDYTFSSAQLDQFLAMTPDLKNDLRNASQTIFYIASDRQRLEGDVALEQASDRRLKRTRSISINNFRSRCLRRLGVSDLTLFLADLWALTIADYHVDHPSSSCSVQIAMNRRQLQRGELFENTYKKFPAITSIPARCWEKLYTDENAADWKNVTGLHVKAVK